MLNKKLTCFLGGVRVCLVVTYANSFSQTLPTEDLSFSSQVISPTDTHCVAKAGDVNRDNKVSLPDIIALIECAFRDCFGYPNCLLDVNGNGVATVSDVIYLVNYIFKGGPAPVKSGVCCL
ncbi:MAG: hypothetical protein A2145_05570 [candidate division Zixibacteria bacterium RBG_16_40_9]|nr:MAG: hypothetical protein A2145_05570 [candidate division Zixibacteria bacterium RBG_16_40_9]